jgi:hypothetical protein
MECAAVPEAKSQSRSNGPYGYFQRLLMDTARPYDVPSEAGRLLGQPRGAGMEQLFANRIGSVALSYPYGIGSREPGRFGEAPPTPQLPAQPAKPSRALETHDADSTKVPPPAHGLENGRVGATMLDWLERMQTRSRACWPDDNHISWPEAPEEKDAVSFQSPGSPSSVAPATTRPDGGQARPEEGRAGAREPQGLKALRSERLEHESPLPVGAKVLQLPDPDVVDRRPVNRELGLMPISDSSNPEFSSKSTTAGRPALSTTSPTKEHLDPPTSKAATQPTNLDHDAWHGDRPTAPRSEGRQKSTPQGMRKTEAKPLVRSGNVNRDAAVAKLQRAIQNRRRIESSPNRSPAGDHRRRDPSVQGHRESQRPAPPIYIVTAPGRRAGGAAFFERSHMGRGGARSYR